MRGPIGAAIGLVFVALAVVVAIWLLPASVLPSRFLPTDCRRVQIMTPDGLLAGAEDIALSEDGELLYISAYDRLAVEEAIELGGIPPEGGLYVMPVSRLESLGDVEAEHAIDPLRISGGMRPHGIAVQGSLVVMINRAFARTGTPSTDLFILERHRDAERDGPRGSLQILDRIASPALCAANDVATDGLYAYVSIDRGTCPGWSFDERIGLTSAGRLERITFAGDVTFQTLIGGLSFANGVALLQGGPYAGPIVAETRGERLLVAAGGQWIEVPLPGGPDNISIDEDGMVIAALHPNLTKLALYRYGYTGEVATRIARVNPVSSQIEILFDDPTGSVYSGASSAVMAGPLMVAGSVRDEGLLICRRGLG